MSEPSETISEADALLLRIYEQCGEGFHTAFRKGVDGKGSHVVWVAIRDMPDNGYHDAMMWFREASGLSEYLRKKGLIRA